ncbi:MAG: pyridoxine 5'-phosphate synthase [Deltaproteobacteria bacterium]|nr:pyridoxine 5'-phosphate synthase [Deltaproteobacteria bacterium]
MAAPIRLGVNVDHVATLRQARRSAYPDPVEAARLAERGGAQGITVHLREDRRHIQDHDVERLRASVRTKLNLEMAATAEMCAKALAVRPDDVCIVPERREELTTEGGLDVVAQRAALREIVEPLRRAGIRVSLFVDPDPRQMGAAAELRVDAVELHTGGYAEARDPYRLDAELARLRACARQADEAGLQVNAGHGLRLDNVRPVAAVREIVELNIGHSIVGRAVFVGLEAAVREMRAALDQARRQS